MVAVERVAGTECFHGEGPCWWDGWGGLRWVDMLAGDVMALDSDGKVSRTHVSDVAAVIRPRASGGALLALRDSFAVTDGPLEELRTIATVEHPPGIRLNEGGCAPDGRFYCGSMATDETPEAGALYCLAADGGVRTVLERVSISNGLDFSPDGTRAYYVDSLRHGIDIFDYSRELGLHNRRRWVGIPEVNGTPDGLVVDATGGVWVALFGGSAVHRYGPDGILDEVVELPVSQVTACTFGGSGLGTLYVTTSCIRADMEACPASGSLFAVDAGVRGRPAKPFAG